MNIKDNFKGKCTECAILYWKFKSCLQPFKIPHFITLQRWCSFHGARMTILWRVLAPLKYKGCIEPFNQCNTEQRFSIFFKDESYNTSPTPVLSRSFIRKRNERILRDSKRIDWRSNYKMNPTLCKNCITFIIRIPAASFKGADAI